MPPESLTSPAPDAGHAGTVSLPPPAARVVLFGVRCGFTAEALRTLLANGARVVGLVLPGPPAVAAPLRVPRRASLPFAGRGLNEWVDDIARTADAEVFQFGALRSPEARETLRSLAPDAIAVACFTRRIPASLHEVAPLGAFNIHPSLLPDKRGPDPLFWVFRNGDRVAGVTVHALADAFDAGPIAARATLPLRDGISEAELDALLARRGAELLLDVLRGSERGALALTPQDDADATAAPWPSAADFVLIPEMTARQAFNFVRGVQARGQPIMAQHGRARVTITRALAWSCDYQRAASNGAATALRFRDGWLLAEVSPLAE